MSENKPKSLQQQLAVKQIRHCLCSTTDHTPPVLDFVLFSSGDALPDRPAEAEV
jgi:hypothetical protein